MTKANMEMEGILLASGGINRVQHQSMQVNSYKIRLNDDVDTPVNYTHELNIIEDLGENDSVTIVLNNNGGALDTAVEFCSAITGTDGYVHGHISGCAHSAASMIFLKCHSFSVSPYATMLVHAASGGFIGKMSENFAQADHFRDWLEFFYKDVYQDFLTDDEIDRVLDGKDFWLNAEQIEERLEKMVEARNERMQKEADEQAEAFIEAELECCDEFDVEGSVECSEDTSGHEYQLGSGLNNRCVSCTCNNKHKFKVGDHVRVISNACGGEDEIGHEDYITYIDGESHCLQSGWYYETEELELVEDGA